MTTAKELGMRFDLSFSLWELNRMYPPNHTGDFMIAINDSHLKAIARAVHFVRSGITSQMSEKLRSAIERDIELLDQTHKFCRQQIIEPGLRMAPEPIEVGNIGEVIGNSPSMPTD